MSGSSAGLSKHDLSLVVVSLIWGGNYTISKIALSHVSPVQYAAIRFTLSTIVLFGALRFLGRSTPLSRPTALRLLGWGVVGHTLNQLCFLNGLRLTTATNSALVFGNLPVVVAVLGAISGHERPAPRVWAGILLGTLGVVLVVGAGGAEFNRSTMLGDAFNVVGLLLWAIFTIGVRRAAEGLGSLQVSAWAHLGGTPGLVLMAVPDLAAVPLGSLHSTVWVGILYSALLSSAIASVLWTRSLKALGGSRTALYNCLTPVVAGAIAWGALGERPLPLQLVGATLVVIGVLASRPPAAPSPVSRLPANKGWPARSARTSSSRATARRRCGITIDPPTTRPIENASCISGSETPASTHWITWYVMQSSQRRTSDATRPSSSLVRTSRAPAS